MEKRVLGNFNEEEARPPPNFTPTFMESRGKQIWASEKTKAEGKEAGTPTKTERRKKGPNGGNDLGETIVSQYVGSEQTPESTSKELSVVEEEKHVPEELRYSEMIALERKREEELSKPVFFNVMVVGETGVGKSTFIDAFLNKRFQRREVIRPPTEAIKTEEGIREWGKTKLVMRMIDTPGYSSQFDVDSCYTLVRGHMRTLMERHRSKQRQERESNDERVHLCLYFLTGPRIKPKDVVFMRKLQKYAPIIPILAKGDTYTTEEIKEMKAELIVQALKEKLSWFDCVEAVGQRDPEKRQQLMSGNFGGSPPFVIVASSDRIEVSENHFVSGRRYRWGICDLENPEHSDFTLLYSLLIGHLSYACKPLVEQLTKDYFRRRKEKARMTEDNQSNRLLNFGAIFLFGTAFLLKEKISRLFQR